MVDERERLLAGLRAAISFARLVQSGDRMLGRGVTVSWRRAHARACELLDECESAGIKAAELDGIIAEGVNAPGPGFGGRARSAEASRGRADGVTAGTVPAGEAALFERGAPAPARPVNSAPWGAPLEGEL